jgi:hypothetical protein
MSGSSTEAPPGTADEPNRGRPGRYELNREERVPQLRTDRCFLRSQDGKKTIKKVRAKEEHQVFIANLPLKKGKGKRKLQGLGRQDQEPAVGAEEVGPGLEDEPAV